MGGEAGEAEEGSAPGVETERPGDTTVVGKKLGCLSLVVLIFYNVSGGPFGSEQAVRAAGPFYALIGFVLFPIVWSLPQALLTAELATTFPDDAGYVSWVNAAYGPAWGFLEGFLALVCGAIDNAVYPSLFIAYLKYSLCDVSLEVDADGVRCPLLDAQAEWFIPSNSYIIILVSSCLLSYFSWRGLELVGRIAIGLTVFMLTPFALLCVLGAPHLRPRAWFNTKPWNPHRHRHGWAGRGRAAPRHVGYDWATYANILFWNLNYWDSASTLAGEVAEPKRNFPRALRWAVAMVVATYVLPMAVCIAALPPGQAWDTGFFVEAGKMLGGPMLQTWMVSAAAVSTVGQFLSVQAGNTYLLLGMAELGLVPACFAVRSRHGAPTFGIALSLAIVLLLATRDMVELVGMLNGVYCLAQLIEFAAFIELRRRLPRLDRPYQVPCGIVGSALMLVGPIGMCIVLLLLPITKGDWKTPLFVAGTLCVGCLLHLATRLLYRWDPGAFLCAPKPRAEADGDDAELKAQPAAKARNMPGVVLHPPGWLPGRFHQPGQKLRSAANVETMKLRDGMDEPPTLIQHGEDPTAQRFGKPCHG